jgi:uncharacterized protein (DUF302 family)
MFHYTLTSTKPFEDVVANIEKKVAENGLRVLHVHDVQQTFGEKGLQFIPYKIIEVCNAKYAKQALDADRLVGLMMPCPIVIWHENKETTISTLRPAAIVDYFPGKGLENFATELENILKKIISESV